MFAELTRFLQENEYLYPNRSSAIQAFLRHDPTIQESERLFVALEQVECQTVGNPVKFAQRLAQLEQEEKIKWQEAQKNGTQYSDEWAYFELKYALAEFYLDAQLNLVAKTHFEELLIMEPTDFLEVKYKLMVVYCRLGNIEKIEQFMLNYDGIKDNRMLILAMLSYLSGLDVEKARQMLEYLWQADCHIEALFAYDGLEHYVEDTKACEDVDEDQFDLMEIMSYVIDLMSDYMYVWVNQEWNRLKQAKMKRQVLITPFQHVK